MQVFPLSSSSRVVHSQELVVRSEKEPKKEKKMAHDELPKSHWVRGRTNGNYVTAGRALASHSHPLVRSGSSKLSCVSSLMSPQLFVQFIHSTTKP